ncbi:hypothetical protein GA0115254_112634 [Streptomyces sp. Ncost-T10-10d]|nr:hypothetical protein GA0115254_112634 [Streptomyces sp. Ncost-T10-10d]
MVVGVGPDAEQVVLLRVTGGVPAAAAVPAAVDGGLHRIGVVSAVTGEWEADYRARIRGLPVRTAVDDLHAAIHAVAAAHGRMHAVRTLRRSLPVLSPAEAIEYVSALLEGDAPGRLVAVATKELVEPLDPVLAVKTIRPGAPRQTG